MALEKKQINFIIDCDVEEIVSLLQEDYGMKILDAFKKSHLNLERLTGHPSI